MLKTVSTLEFIELGRVTRLGSNWPGSYFTSQFAVTTGRAGRIRGVVAQIEAWDGFAQMVGGSNARLYRRCSNNPFASFK